MRKAKEGVVKDLAGNVIEDVKPTYTVQAGTWGPPKDVEKVRGGGGGEAGTVGGRVGGVGGGCRTGQGKEGAQRCSGRK